MDDLCRPTLHQEKKRTKLSLTSFVFAYFSLSLFPDPDDDDDVLCCCWSPYASCCYRWWTHTPLRTTSVGTRFSAGPFGFDGRRSAGCWGLRLRKQLRLRQQSQDGCLRQLDKVRSFVFDTKSFPYIHSLGYFYLFFSSHCSLLSNTTIQRGHLSLYQYINVFYEYNEHTHTSTEYLPITTWKPTFIWAYLQAYTLYVYAWSYNILAWYIRIYT